MAQTENKKSFIERTKESVKRTVSEIAQWGREKINKAREKFNSLRGKSKELGVEEAPAESEAQAGVGEAMVEVAETDPSRASRMAEQSQDMADFEEDNCREINEIFESLGGEWSPLVEGEVEVEEGDDENAARALTEMAGEAPAGAVSTGAGAGLEADLKERNRLREAEMALERMRLVGMEVELSTEEMKNRHMRDIYQQEDPDAATSQAATAPAAATAQAAAIGTVTPVENPTAKPQKKEKKKKNGKNEQSATGEAVGDKGRALTTTEALSPEMAKMAEAAKALNEADRQALRKEMENGFTQRALEYANRFPRSGEDEDAELRMAVMILGAWKEADGHDHMSNPDQIKKALVYAQEAKRIQRERVEDQMDDLREMDGELERSDIDGVKSGESFAETFKKYEQMFGSYMERNGKMRDQVADMARRIVDMQNVDEGKDYFRDEKRKKDALVYANLIVANHYLEK